MPHISTFAENNKETNEVVSDADEGDDSDENYMTKTDVDYLFAFKSMDVAIKSDQAAKSEERLRQESLEAKKLAELKEIKNKTGFTIKSSM